MCSELHNVKDAIYENKRKMEAVCEDFQIQVSKPMCANVMKEECDKCMVFIFYFIITGKQNKEIFLGKDAAES